MSASPQQCSPQGRQPRPAASKWLVLVVMCVGYFLVLLDVTVVNVALPKIGAGIGAHLSGLQWVVDGYALALAALLLAGGTIGDLRGHKRVVLSGLVIFGVASLGCGLAPDTGVLIGARAVQGVGAALLLPGTLAIITHAFPGKGEQARAIGIWAGVGSVALPAGPLLGGALIAGFGWRAVFLINVPVVAIAGVVAARVVTETIGDPHRRLDRPGVITAGVFLTAVTFAFIQAGHSGLGRPVVAAIVVAVAAAVVFVAVERSRSDPMLPLRLFTRRDFSTANTVAGVMNLGTLGLLFLLTLYLQTVQHRSALAAGVAVLPLFAPLSVLAPIGGRLTARLGAKVPMAIGLVAAGVGVALLARLQPHSAYLTLLPAMLAWGVGLGLLTPAVVAAAVGAVDADRAGLASGVNNTFRQAGGAIGIAAFGALAGAPTATQSFVTGFRHAGLLTAALFAAATVAAITLIPSKPSGE
ncbi:MAG: MFS transporter [Acidimicrobiales bacterium]